MYDELSEVIEYLKSIADRFDIEYFWPSALSPSTPPAAKPSKKRIVMNPNWHNAREIPFQFAHEIAHILNDDDTKKYCDIIYSDKFALSCSDTG